MSEPSESADAGAGDGLMTIDVLAERTGITVRNLREWRTLGLMPRAEMHGRVGYYPPEVLERIERIKKLRTEGFTLELIRRMLDVTGPAGDDAMRLAEILRGPFREGEGEAAEVDPEELSAAGEDAIQRAVKLGLIRERDGEGYEFATQRIADVAVALREVGLEAGEILEVATEVRAVLSQVTERFEGVWLEHVWAPVAEGGPTEEEMARIAEAAERMPSLALDTVVALFAIAMEQQVEGGIQRELDRLERRGAEG